MYRAPAAPKGPEPVVVAEARPPGWQRALGASFLLAALVPFGVAVVTMKAAFGCCGLPIALVCLVIAMPLIREHRCSLDLETRELIDTQRWGPFKREKRHPFDHLPSITVRRHDSADASGTTTFSVWVQSLFEPDIHVENATEYGHALETANRLAGPLDAPIDDQAAR